MFLSLSDEELIEMGVTDAYSILKLTKIRDHLKALCLAIAGPTAMSRAASASGSGSGGSGGSGGAAAAAAAASGGWG